jgi:DinB family protein
VDKRLRLLKILDKAWGRLLESYAGLTDSELLENGAIGAWSVKDIITHVTSWEKEALRHLPIVLAGDRPPRYSVTYGGIDAFNAQTTQRNKDLSLSEVLQERDHVHQRLIKFIESAPYDQIGGGTRFRNRLRLDTYSHYPKHAEAIMKWRKRKTASSK